TAAALLKEFGTLDNILANVERVPGAKKQENLRAWAAKEQISRQLVRLVTDVSVEFDWEGWRLQPWDKTRLLSLFRGWGFRTFAARVQADDAPAARAGNGMTQGELFPFGANAEANGTAPAAEEQAPPAADERQGWKATYHLIDTPAKFRAFSKELQ